MEDKLQEIKIKIESFLKKSETLEEIENIKINFLGKKGELTQILKDMKNLPKEEKPKIGKIINELRNDIDYKINSKKQDIESSLKNKKILEEFIDVTIPGKSFKLGRKHPMTLVLDDIKNIFLGMGYEIAEGPDIEEEYYNFDALNIPKDHPAKDEQDTFYIGNKYLLRTQTSPVQVRVMEKGKLPIKIIAPGRVFRADEVDATHSPIFHQLEGLLIDENISMADLKGTLITFVKEFLGENIKFRFRPHYFPFTEPSAEMDISCFSCNGKGCRICKNTGWIELLGCGMVHPEVLKMSNIDSEKYSGFAFGIGLERIAMERYNISDLRIMYENDIRFLKQF